MHIHALGLSNIYIKMQWPRRQDDQSALGSKVYPLHPDLWSCCRCFPPALLKHSGGVACNQWDHDAIATNKHLPEADIVHDRFHISKYLKEAVDTVRCQFIMQGIGCW